MTPVTSSPAGEELIQVDGTFDAVAAWNLRKRLREVPSGVRVVLDFTRVKEFLDLGVAVVAPGLLDRDGPRVSVRGLRQHQHRMFRYFGVDVGTAVGAAVAEAAEAAERDASA